MSENGAVGDDEPDFIVVGEKVALGPLRKDLARSYGRWVNHREVRFGLDNLGIATPETEEKWVEDNTNKSAEEEPTGAHFTVYDRSDSAPVGTAGLFAISHVHGHANFGIALGERRGRGLGTEATRLVLDWGFTVLGLRNVMLEVLTWNEAAIVAYERAGFRRVGIRRAAVFSRGERADVLFMDAVPEDFGPSAL